ncbi:hypothetical protein D1007_51264 [Hordeum vulgare]|nr:hypothetical protein D1007_51264 [Hordeum vulgare]
MTHTERISNGVTMKFGVHLMESHMRKMDLPVVYYNDRVMVEDSINTMERLPGEDDKYKMVGLDFPNTGGHAGLDQNVVIAHLCMHHHVLLYPYYLAIVPCKCFTRLVNNPNYRFTMVDTTNYRNVLNTLGLSYEKLINIRGHYKIWGSKKDMNSDIDLSEAITDAYYGGMKAECEKNKHVWHMALVKRLDEYHP